MRFRLARCSSKVVVGVNVTDVVDTADDTEGVFVFVVVDGVDFGAVVEFDDEETTGVEMVDVVDVTVEVSVVALGVDIAAVLEDTAEVDVTVVDDLLTGVTLVTTGVFIADTVLDIGAVLFVTVGLLTGIILFVGLDLFARLDLFAGVVVTTVVGVVFIVIEVGDVVTDVKFVFLLVSVNVGETVVFIVADVEIIWGLVILTGDTDVVFFESTTVDGAGAVTTGVAGDFSNFGGATVGLVLVTVADGIVDTTFSGVTNGLAIPVALFEADAVDGIAAGTVGDATGEETGDGVDAGDFVMLGLR